MSQKMENYHQSNDYGDQRSWLWSKAISVGKKVLTVGVVLSSAPLLIPPLVVVSTIAFLSSVPFCLFLANYACTQKLLRSLLPDTEEVSGTDEEESTFEYSKLGHGEGSDKVGEAELFKFTNEPIEEDEEMGEDTTSLIEKIRDEGRNDKGTSQKELQDGKKSKNVKVHDLPEKQEAPGTEQEGELEASTTETSTSKDEETSSNEPIDQASGTHGTGEEKRKHTNKKKKKTGRAGKRFVYSEEQIWEKMEALRKVVGYSIARSATFAEELKALYVFTGVVEPPQSSLNHDTRDIAEVTLRLRFLMSVVGIN